MVRKKVQVEQPFTGKEQIRDQSITEFGIHAMTRYATAVNLDRAVPELYDGFKPCARRILCRSPGSTACTPRAWQAPWGR